MSHLVLVKPYQEQIESKHAGPDLTQFLLARHLTNREIQVSYAATIGMCNKEIASQLEIKVETVRHYIKSSRERLGCKSRAQLIVLCLPLLECES